MFKSDKPIFLDVDSSIVEHNLRFTNNSAEDDFSRVFEKDIYPSKIIKPVPGLCVKTKEVGNDTKVFVNICKTDAIPPPKEITVQELEAILESDEPGDYRVPMSIGELRTDKDKKDQEAKVVDIAIHPEFFNKVETVEEFKRFFMAIVFQGLENKYGLICEDEKVILKNRKAFGTLQMHRIQQREIAQKMSETNKPSLIGEISGQNEQKKVVIETISSTDNSTKEPVYRLYKKKGQNCLFGEFKFPDVISAQELLLDIGEDRIVLESKMRGYLLDIFFPYIVKQKSCSSTFDKANKMLTVKMPLMGG